MEKLEWSALEYQEKERSSDWFWAFGIIFVSSSIAAIIFGNYFFATFLVISGLLLGFLAVKRPEMISCELNTQGLKIRNHLYPYVGIKSFWVQIDTTGTGELRPTLFIKSERVFMPEISISINEDDAEDIRSIMLDRNVAEEEMKENTSTKIMEILGF